MLFCLRQRLNARVRFTQPVHRWLQICPACRGSKKDRHHSLGEGELGWDVFRYIMQDERFDHVPMALETIDDSIWADEIAALKMLVA